MDISFPFQPANVAKAFSEHIRTGCFSFKNTDAASVLEFLYTAYADVQDRDPKEIDQGFIRITSILEFSRVAGSSKISFSLYMSMWSVQIKPHNIVASISARSNTSGSQNTFV